MSSEPLKTAISQLGSMNALAIKLGITKAAVHQWTLEGRRVPAKHCVAIETATEGAVTRHDLRPDVFGVQPAIAPAPPAPSASQQQAA
ncbi:MAG: helix-turn-helix domain-containing protein [Gammaproteobacteria bacterium]|nr:helix-turn-helix domain-containing protein [Gammaproteobacteria bacterium]